MSLTEAYVIKQATERPVLIKDIKALNIMSVCVNDVTEIKSEEEYARRVQKMFYKVWSGLTKYVRSVLLVQRKAVQITDLGIFETRLKELNGFSVPSADGYSDRLSYHRLA